jgi:hypothetical protein
MHCLIIQKLRNEFSIWCPDPPQRKQGFVSKTGTKGEPPNQEHWATL